MYLKRADDADIEAGGDHASDGEEVALCGCIDASRRASEVPAAHTEREIEREALGRLKRDAERKREPLR